TTIYVAGPGTGLTVATFGTQAATATVINALNSRLVYVAGDQLYDSSGSSGANAGVNTVGAGLPTTAATATALPAGSTASNSYYFLDRDSGVAGVDQLFVADGTSGVKKYSFDGTTWTLQGTLTGNFFGVALAPNGTGTDIYLTSGNGAGAATTW